MGAGEEQVTLEYRGPIFYTAPGQAVLGGKGRVIYGGKGKVIRSAIGPHTKGKGLAVFFPGNAGLIDCYLTDLSRTAPPTTLPGGYSVGDEVFFTGVGQTLNDGDHQVYGGKGEVVGPLGVDAQIAVLFPGNKLWMVCDLTELSRTAPPTTFAGGYSVGDEVFWTGASHTISTGLHLVNGGKGEVIGPATYETHKGKGVKLMFPENDGWIDCYLIELSRTPPRAGLKLAMANLLPAFATTVALLSGLFVVFCGGKSKKQPAARVHARKMAGRARKATKTEAAQARKVAEAAAAAAAAAALLREALRGQAAAESQVEALEQEKGKIAHAVAAESQRAAMAEAQLAESERRAREDRSALDQARRDAETKAVRADALAIQVIP